jgi:hypothetical protein
MFAFVYISFVPQLIPKFIDSNGMTRFRRPDERRVTDIGCIE